jgi:putative addiction module component (TIGR02574 family)
MSPKAHEVLEQARQLTEDERRALALQLLDELDEPDADSEGDVELSPEWAAELRRRIQDADENPDDAVDWSDLREELRTELLAK